MTAFDFIAAYRDLDGSASREVVEARHKGFQKLLPAITKMEYIYDLCRLAYQIEPFPARPWFEDAIREFDPHFVVSKDKADAGRMAALLLQYRIASPGSYAPLAVLVASYCGRRHSIDGDVLTTQANRAFLAAVRNQRISNGAQMGTAPKIKVPSEVEAIPANNNPLTGSVGKVAIEAATASAEAAVNELSESVKRTTTSARSDIMRLAEEVDMLWWCIGDWHELLDKPRTETAGGLKMLVSGIELGMMVRQLPGPYGAHGILRRISGAEADGKSSLKATVTALSQDDARKIAKEVSEAPRPLFPIHAAIQSVAQHGATWETELAKAVPDIVSAQISPLELGIQAYRERALIGQGGIS